MFDTGIQRNLNLDASNGLTISFWVMHSANTLIEIISDGSKYLKLKPMAISSFMGTVGHMPTTEGGRFIKADIVVDTPNNCIKVFKNGICTGTVTAQGHIDYIVSLLTGEKNYVLLKRLHDDDAAAIQHFEIRHGVPTDKEVYDSYFSGLTDNY